MSTASDIIINSTEPRVQYTAIAAQTIFVYGFPIFETANLAVYVGSTLKVFSTDYTITGVGTANGGTVVFNSGLAAGDIVTIYGNLALGRSSDYANAPAIVTADLLNDDLDRLAMLEKQLDMRIRRAIRSNLLSPDGGNDFILPAKAARLNKLLGFNATTGAVEAVTRNADQVTQQVATPNYPATTAENNASVVPTVLSELPGNVLRYGAVGDGVADDTVPIQRAVDVCGQSGPNVFLPAGTYLITASITSTDDSIVIEGESGVGWSTGARTKILVNSTITVFDLGSAVATSLIGPTLRNFSIDDSGGTALGAVLIRNFWHCIFDNITVNGFLIGFCFHLDGTGGAIANTRFANVLGRQNKFGIKVTGTVAATRYEDNCYFALSGAIAGSIGVEIKDGWVLGGVDSYETGVKLVGDSCRVSARLEANALHVHIAGTTARRNIITGTHFILGGATASVQIDNNANIFDNIIALNNYTSPTIGIVDNTVSPQNNYIFEPQQNDIFMRRNTVGTVRHEIRNSRNVAAGDNAEYMASAANGAIKAILRAATPGTNSVQIGSATDQIVDLLVNEIIALQGRRDISIGSNETALMIRVDRSGAKTLSTVSIGAVDSGGTGFKVLRVVN